jgi:tRNA modification GTPase
VGFFRGSFYKMIPDPDDTIVAVSSAAGPGLRAIIRISGPRACSVAEAVFTSTHPTRKLTDSTRHFTPGQLKLTDVHSPLPADGYFFRSPHSYTGQDLVELHTISSPPLVERLVADLLAASARPAQPGEFTLRAFLSGKKDLTRAEAVLSVIEANTEDELKQALQQLAGGLANPMDALRDDLLSLLADVEAGLDFVEEDIEFVARPDLLRRIAAGLATLQTLSRQLDERTISGRAVRVVLVGEPNAGKSSLFNILAGTGTSTAAIVSPIPGTTRDYLLKRLDLGGVPVELIDTAGWQQSTDTIEAQAQQLAGEQTRDADIVLWCVPNGEVNFERTRPSGNVVLVRTKADIANCSGDWSTSIFDPDSIEAFRAKLTELVQSLARSSLAPSQSRCRHHVESAIDSLQRAHSHVSHSDPQELLALELRKALDQLGEMVGAVYTNDLLDRIFSRFCIGK